MVSWECVYCMHLMRLLNCLYVPVILRWIPWCDCCLSVHCVGGVCVNYSLMLHNVQTRENNSCMDIQIQHSQLYTNKDWENAIHLMRQFDRLMAYHWHRPPSPLHPPYTHTHTHTHTHILSLSRPPSSIKCAAFSRSDKIKIRFESYAYGTLKRQVTLRVWYFKTSGDVTRIVLWNVRWRYAYGTLKRQVMSVGHSRTLSQSQSCLSMSLQSQSCLSMSLQSQSCLSMSLQSQSYLSMSLQSQSCLSISLQSQSYLSMSLQSQSCLSMSAVAVMPVYEFAVAVMPVYEFAVAVMPVYEFAVTVMPVYEFAVAVMPVYEFAVTGTAAAVSCVSERVIVVNVSTITCSPVTKTPT